MKQNFFLTGNPGFGKTTVLKRIIKEIGKDNCVGFYTEEIQEDNERIGFKIYDTDGNQGILASIYLDRDVKIGRYGVDMEVFEKICIPIIKNVDENKVIIIDEIGPMQMLSNEFKDLLCYTMMKENVILGTIFYKDYPWIDEFKSRFSLNLILLDCNNRENIHTEIANEIKNQISFK